MGEDSEAVAVRYYRADVTGPYRVFHLDGCVFQDKSICTCGLLRDLDCLSLEERTEIYPAFFVEAGKQKVALEIP